MGDLVHMSGKADIEVFLAALWPSGLPKGCLLCIYTLPNRMTHWCTLAEAPSLVARLSKRLEVYVGVGVGVPRQKDANRSAPRLNSDEVVYFPAVVGDFDVSRVGHKGANLWASYEEVAAFLDAIFYPPTLRVHTGGGVQCWWMFHTPIYVPEIGRAAAEEITKGWAAYLQRAAKAFAGRPLDAVWDLARIMRIPDSLNHKGDEPRSVYLLASGGRRYEAKSPEAPPLTLPTAASSLEAPHLRNPAAVEPTHEDFVLSAHAEPPAAKFAVMMQLEPKFRLSWHRERKGLSDPKNASNTDMSLANYGAGNGWSEQEIVNLLIAHRRFHRDDLNLDRHDYYRKTLEKAFAKRRENVAMDELDEAMSTPGTKPDRDKLLAVVQKTTGVPIARLVMTGDHKPVFAVHLDDGQSVPLGSQAKLMSFDTWSGIAWIHGDVVHRPKAGVWLKTLKALQLLVEFEESEESAETALFMGWVRKRLGDAQTFATEPPPKTELLLLVQSGAPFVRNDRLHLTLTDLADQVRLVERRPLAEAEVLRLLRLCKFKTENVQVWNHGKNVQRRYWTLPVEIVENFGFRADPCATMTDQCADE